MLVTSPVQRQTPTGSALARFAAEREPQQQTQSVAVTGLQGELKSSSAAWEMTVYVDRDEFPYFYEILRNESPIRFTYGGSVGLAEAEVTKSEVEWISLGTLEYEPVGGGPVDRS
jgi:hypothetical protein